MQQIKFLATLFLVGIILTSCEPNYKPNESKSYWESGDCVRQQLKGKVKQLNDGQHGSTMILQFDRQGRFTNVDIGTFVSATYTYNTQGQIISVTNKGEGTTLFTYGDHGKYILYDVPRLNLQSMSSPNYKIDIVVESKSKVLQIRTIEGVKDTTILTYDGKYPIKVESKYGVESFTYASNGMYASIEEVYPTQTRKIKYKADPQFLLIESVFISYSDGKRVSVKYIYNKNKDLTEIQEYDEQNKVSATTEYSDYVYDSNNNWTSRKMREMNYNGKWGEYTTQKRTITYW